MYQSNLLLVPSKAFDTFTNNTIFYDHQWSKGSEILWYATSFKCSNKVTFISVLLKLQSVSQFSSDDSLQPHESQHARPPCPSSLIVHKSLLGILFKCRFLIKWGLKFQFLKKPLDDADAVNSVRLLGIAVSRPFLGHKCYTGKWFGNFPSRLCLCWWK